MTLFAVMVVVVVVSEVDVRSCKSKQLLELQGLPSLVRRYKELGKPLIDVDDTLLSSVWRDGRPS